LRIPKIHVTAQGEWLTLWPLLYLNLIKQTDAPKNRLQVVIAIGPSPKHMQKQIELRGRKQRQR
jgi:deoxyadenosine/deoxycytidine kinase